MPGCKEEVMTPPGGDESEDKMRHPGEDEEEEEEVMSPPGIDEERAAPRPRGSHACACERHKR